MIAVNPITNPPRLHCAAADQFPRVKCAHEVVIPQEGHGIPNT
jgi:hypothetical protein